MDAYETITFHSISDLKQQSSKDSTIITDVLRGYKVSVLTGSSKVGKSALALDMAYAIATGGNFLNFKCHQQQVLYITIDNDSDLIGERINKMRMKSVENIRFFCGQVKLGSNEIENEDVVYLKDVILKAINDELPELRVVFIDLWDNVREVNPTNEYSNTHAQKEIEYLKELSATNEVAIVLLTHDSKASSNKGYNSAKGATEFIGTINGSYMHLIRNGIGETSAILEIGGRNIKETVLHILFNPATVSYEINESPEEMDINIAMIRNYLNAVGKFEGTASSLCSKAKLLISAIGCGRLLSRYKDELENEGIHIVFPTNHHERIYKIESDNFTG